MRQSLLLLLFLAAAPCHASEPSPTADEILQGLKDFYRQTARPDGSFQPGIDPEYRGMSDSAYSDLAAVTYAVTIHKTFGWKLPYEDKTAEFLLARQKPNGDFFNVAGTVAAASPEGRTYNTTQGLVALHALGRKPRYDPLPVFEAILKEDYKQLPAYSTSFFPLAYLCAGQPIPEKADRGIRALMVQDETGYSNDHVAATFHASHYYRLVGEPTPRAQEMVARILRDQKRDGGWLLNLPGRDRHATFDAVFTLRHEGKDLPECRAAIARAAQWAISCRNPDGGFGHFPGSTSDADAVYFQVGTLVMAGLLKPADPLPRDPHLLSWGHLMLVVNKREHAPQLAFTAPGWVACVAFSPSGDRLASASADAVARIIDAKTGQELVKCQGHDDAVAAVHFHSNGKLSSRGVTIAPPPSGMPPLGNACTASSVIAASSRRLPSAPIKLRWRPPASMGPSSSGTSQPASSSTPSRATSRGSIPSLTRRMAKCFSPAAPTARSSSGPQRPALRFALLRPRKARSDPSPSPPMARISPPASATAR